MTIPSSSWPKGSCPWNAVPSDQCGLPSNLIRSHHDEAGGEHHDPRSRFDPHDLPSGRCRGFALRIISRCPAAKSDSASRPGRRLDTPTAHPSPILQEMDRRRGSAVSWASNFRIGDNPTGAPRAPSTTYCSDANNAWINQQSASTWKSVAMVGVANRRQGRRKDDVL